MSCLIIEDEFPAAARLRALIEKVAPSMVVGPTLESVEKAVAYLREQPHPDLIFSDIHLSDGLSFDIYRQVPVGSPIIFTTAFDQYAIKAFEVNSIDYLLKPIRADHLQKALAKWQQRKVDLDFQAQFRQMLAQMPMGNTPPKSYKTRFLVKGRDQLIPVEAGEIAYFSSAHEVVYLVTYSGRRWALDFTLDELEQKLDPQDFFRLNRQFLGSLNAIEAIHPYFNGRLKLQLQPAPQKEVLVSREKAKRSKAWLEGEKEE